MPRPVVVFASLATFGALGSLVYLHASRTSSDPSDPHPLIASGEMAPRASLPSVDGRASPANPSIATVEREDSTASVNPTESTQPTAPDKAAPNNVEQWVADSRSDDAKTRAAAIAALAGAPKAQAVPALVYVVESGEPQVDRQIALLSLRTLAVNDGDSDGAIRDVIRKAMYHTDDDGVMQSAQALLEDIEAEFAERALDAR